MDFTVNLSKLPPAAAHAVIKGLQHEDRARYAIGRAEQLRLKRFHDAVPNVALGGELRQTLCISEDQWLRLMQRYGQLCLADPDFGKFLYRNHDDFRVPDRPTRIQSGYTGKHA